jgi:O-methyltransferase
MCAAVRHVCKRSVPGDIVECGVWRGGSMMAAALALLEQDQTPKMHLFDTFSGMTKAGAEDGNTQEFPAGSLSATEDEVRANMLRTGYPADRFRLIAGPVEETLPAEAPPSISVLRLDTDWYSSTIHELHHLYPLLSYGGVLIVDDYGHWQGARRAVNEYLAGSIADLVPIDETGVMLVKETTK